MNIKSPFIIISFFAFFFISLVFVSGVDLPQHKPFLWKDQNGKVHKIDPSHSVCGSGDWEGYLCKTPYWRDISVNKDGSDISFYCPFPLEESMIRCNYGCFWNPVGEDFCILEKTNKPSPDIDKGEQVFEPDSPPLTYDDTGEIVIDDSVLDQAVVEYNCIENFMQCGSGSDFDPEGDVYECINNDLVKVEDCDDTFCEELSSYYARCEVRWYYCSNDHGINCFLSDTNFGNCFDSLDECKDSLGYCCYTRDDRVYTWRLGGCIRDELYLQGTHVNDVVCLDYNKEPSRVCAYAYDGCSAFDLPCYVSTWWQRLECKASMLWGNFYKAYKLYIWVFGGLVVIGLLYITGILPIMILIFKMVIRLITKLLRSVIK